MQGSVKKNLLLVESDTAKRNAIKTIFAEMGPVEEAENGAAALELIRARKFDAVFLAHSLADMPATAILRHLYNPSQKMSPAPMILLSDNAEEEGMEEAFSLGAETWLHKAYITPAAARLALLQAERSFQAQKTACRTEKMLAQLQAPQGLENFVNGVSHDLNNILTVVMGNTKLMLRSLQPETATLSRDEILKKLYPIEKSALKGMELVKSLGQLAGAKTTARAKSNLEKCISVFRATVKNRPEDFDDVKVILADDLWSVQADGDQLVDTLLNMVMNSDYRRTRDRNITLETENITLDRDYTAVHAHAKPGQYVMVTLSHTGGKARGKLLQYVLYPVFARKKIYDQSEEGLSQVYNFVRRSDGYIHIYSEKNFGSVFRLYLPKETEKEMDNSVEEPLPVIEKAEEETHGPLPTGKEAVLVVEDDPELSDAACAILEELGYRVYTANNAVAAMGILRTEKIDLVFTDVILQGTVNGIELGQNISKAWPGMKILYTSGFTKNAMPQDKAFADNEFIGKPYHRHALALKIHESLTRKERRPASTQKMIEEETIHDRKTVNHRY